MHETVTLLPAADFRSQLDFWLWQSDVPLALLIDGDGLDKIVVPYLQRHRQKNRGIVFALEPEREMSFPVAEAIAALLNYNSVFDQFLDRPTREWPLIWRENIEAYKEKGGIHHVLMVESVELMVERPLEERLEFMALLFALAAEPGLSVVLMIQRGAWASFLGIPGLDKLDFSSACPVQPLAKTAGLARAPIPAPSPEIQEMSTPVLGGEQTLARETTLIEETSRGQENSQAREKTQVPERNLSPAFLVVAVMATIGVVVAINFSAWKAAALKISERGSIPRKAVLSATKTVPITVTESSGFAWPLPETWPQPKAETEPVPAPSLPAEPRKSYQPSKIAAIHPLDVAVVSRNLEIHLPKIMVGIELPALSVIDSSAGVDLAMIDLPIEPFTSKIPDRASTPTVTTAAVEPRRIVQTEHPALKLPTNLLETVSFVPPVVQLQILPQPVSLTLEIPSPLDGALNLFPEGPAGEIKPLFPRKPERKAAPGNVSAVLKRFKNLKNQTPEGLRQAYTALIAAEPGRSFREVEDWLNQASASPQTFDRDIGLAFRQSGDLEAAFVWFYKWARRSDEAEALFEVGAAKFLGLGTSRNVSLAIPYLFRAWQFGDGDSGYLYGVAQLFGWGLPRNEADAFATFQEACQLGSVRPYREMARMSELGMGVPLNLNAARDYYQKGAETGDPYCLQRLAEMDESGNTSAAGAALVPSTQSALDPVHKAVTHLQAGDFYTRRISTDATHATAPLNAAKIAPPL